MKSHICVLSRSQRHHAQGEMKFEEKKPAMPIGPLRARRNSTNKFPAAGWREKPPRGFPWPSAEIACFFWPRGLLVTKCECDELEISSVPCAGLIERITDEKLNLFRTKGPSLSFQCGDIPRLTYDDTTLPPPGKAVRPQRFARPQQPPAF